MSHSPPLCELTVRERILLSPLTTWRRSKSGHSFRKKSRKIFPTGREQERGNDTSMRRRVVKRRIPAPAILGESVLAWLYARTRFARRQRFGLAVSVGRLRIAWSGRELAARDSRLEVSRHGIERNAIFRTQLGRRRLEQSIQFFFGWFMMERLDDESAKSTFLTVAPFALYRHRLLHGSNRIPFSSAMRNF